MSGPAAGNDKNQWAENFAASEAGSLALMTEHYYISNYSSAAPSIAGMLAWRATRANQMVQQYPWLYARSGPLGWREIGRENQS